MHLSLALAVFAFFAAVPATLAAQPSVYIPLDESQSAPAIDLLSSRGTPIDPGVVADQIKSGIDQETGRTFDSSNLDPQTSDLYVAKQQPMVLHAPNAYPAGQETFIFQNPLPDTRGLVRARVVPSSDPNTAYQLQFSLDTHAALARNALLRVLGYNIPSPKYYPKLTVQFANLKDRDQFLDRIADKTLTSRGRWVVGGLDEIQKNQTTLTFQDVSLESALINVPQMHWGILSNANVQQRRSIRSLIVPLSVLDITESVNMLAFESAKISNEHLVFTRPFAEAFNSETSIGDVRWMAKRMAKLNRQDWMNIIQAGKYPADIQALIVEKVIGRMVQLLSLLGIPNTSSLKYDPYISYGQVINGKAMQEQYEGYALRFTYGDPESPLRASELLRFFGIESISSGLGYMLDKIGGYIQIITPDRYINQQQERTFLEIQEHMAKNPNQPYVQPLQTWGGPIAGGSLKATRNIVTGSYYGSKSEVQLVDSVSAGVSLGEFIGISGISRLSAAVSPLIQYNRSYVHVRPLQDIKSAWKDNWKNIYVPHFMKSLSGILKGDPDQSASDAIQAFLSNMKTGEMFIVTDGFSAGSGTTVGIPIGAIMGFLPPFSKLSESATLSHQYGILSRTTIYKAADGLHVYLSRIHSNSFEVSLDTSFFVKVLSIASARQSGDAHTKAFVFPETFDTQEKQKAFQRAVTSILKRNNPSIMEEEFSPYSLDHDVHGRRFRLQIGPWSWTNRVSFHRLDILPPVDSEARYQREDQKRTIIEGQITKIKGSDLYGFFGRLIRRIVPFINIGNGARGDDPSTNFLGKSRTFSVATEMEITPTRPNNVFTKMQQSYNGWNMKKTRLLRIMKEMTEELQEFDPGGTLVSRDQFAQTKKIQAYNLMWTLLVYEKAISRLLNVLDINHLSTEKTQKFLTSIMGEKEYAQWCDENEFSTEVSVGPYWNDGRSDGNVVEITQGRTTYVGCVTPWMKTVYDLRSKLSGQSEVFATDIRDEDGAIEKIKWINQSLTSLEKDMDLAQLIRWLGNDSVHFQVRISGFRTNDEAADSERYSTYFSNTIGTIDEKTLGGPMSEVSEASQILEHELSARYLSNGY